MKKIVFVICLLAALALFADLQDTEITVSSGTVNNGETISIDITTTELLEEYDVISFQFEMNYDSESVTYTDFTEGDILSENGMLLVNETEPGTLRAAFSHYEAQTGAGVLMRLVFTGIADSTILDIHDFKFNATGIENATDGSIVVVNTGVTETIPEQITQVGIHSISPNPFNPSTTISFLVPENETEVTVNIYSVKGQLVKRYHPSGLTPNTLSSINWQGVDDHNREVASGIYFCEVKGISSKACSKMLLLK